MSEPSDRQWAEHIYHEMSDEAQRTVPKEAFVSLLASRCESVRGRAKMTPQEQRLVEALRLLYNETADYIRVNNLGDVHHNRSMQLARAALASVEETATPTRDAPPVVGNGDYSCAQCGIGMPEPCEHWENLAAQSPEEAPDRHQAILDEVLGDELPAAAPSGGDVCDECGSGKERDEDDSLVCKNPSCGKFYLQLSRIKRQHAQPSRRKVEGSFAEDFGIPIMDLENLESRDAQPAPTRQILVPCRLCGHSAHPSKCNECECGAKEQPAAVRGDARMTWQDCVICGQPKMALAVHFDAHANGNSVVLTGGQPLHWYQQPAPSESDRERADKLAEVLEVVSGEGRIEAEFAAVRREARTLLCGCGLDQEGKLLMCESHAWGDLPSAAKSTAVRAEAPRLTGNDVASIEMYDRHGEVVLTDSEIAEALNRRLAAKGQKE